MATLLAELLLEEEDRTEEAAPCINVGRPAVEDTDGGEAKDPAERRKEEPTEPSS